MAQSELLSAKKSATQGAREASAALRLRSSRVIGNCVAADNAVLADFLVTETRKAGAFGVRNCDYFAPICVVLRPTNQLTLLESVYPVGSRFDSGAAHQTNVPFPNPPRWAWLTWPERWTLQSLSPWFTNFQQTIPSSPKSLKP